MRSLLALSAALVAAASVTAGNCRTLTNVPAGSYVSAETTTVTRSYAAAPPAAFDVVPSCACTTAAPAAAFDVVPSYSTTYYRTAAAFDVAPARSYYVPPAAALAPSRSYYVPRDLAPVREVYRAPALVPRAPRDIAYVPVPRAPRPRDVAFVPVPAPAPRALGPVRQGFQDGGLLGAAERFTGLGDGSGQVGRGAILGILATRANVFGLGNGGRGGRPNGR